MAKGDPVSSREPSEPVALEPRPSAWLVRLTNTEFALPRECACCGALAAREVRVSDGQHGELLVGYCEACATHVARDATRRLAAALSSVLVGLALAAALPIVFPWQSLLACTLLAWLGALLPLASSRFGRRASAGHAAVGRAVWFRSPGQLLCRSESFARAVAASAAGTAEPASPARSLPFVEGLVVSALTLLAAPFSHAFHHPPVRVLDLGASAMTLFVDGHRVGRVEPSSGESPLSGLELRLPAGRRVLLGVADDGAVIGQARVELQAGSRHLYAPGAAEVCFWLETTGYGREGKLPDYTPLEGEDRFWVVPEAVNGWFMPSPPSAEGVRATGGSSTVLRQGPCDDVPYSR